MYFVKVLFQNRRVHFTVEIIPTAHGVRKTLPTTRKIVIEILKNLQKFD